MPENFGPLLTDIARTLSDHGQEIAVLKSDQKHIVEDRARCNLQHTGQLKELAATVSKLEETVRTHVQADREHKASLDAWSKLLLAASPVLTAIIAALAAYWAAQ